MNELKDKLLNRIKEKEGGKNAAPTVSKEKAPAGGKLSQFLNEVKELRDVLLKVMKENEENRAHLDKAKKTMDGYRKTITQLEEENKKLNERIDKYNVLKQGPAGKQKTDDKASAKLDALTKEKMELERKLSEMSGKLAAAGAAKGGGDPKKAAFLEMELRKKDEVIEGLLSQKKIEPQQERLMLVWLNSSLQQERKNNVELRKKLAALEPESKKKDNAKK